MSLSIKARLLLWMIGGISVLLLVFAIVVYEVMVRSLVGGFDAVLASTARTIHGAIEQDRETIKIEIDARELPEFSRSQRPDYFEVWREDGTILARSPSLKAGDLEHFEGPLDSFVYRSGRLPDGRVGRAVALLFVPKVDEDLKGLVLSRRVSLVVARETAALDTEIRFLKWLLAAATGGTILLALFVGGVVVRQGLRPLDTLAAQISAIRQDDLSVQIPLERLPAELVPVVARLKDLLHRLEEAFRRERAFTADAAHELRTPLAGLRTTMEVALARPRSGDDYRQSLKECLEITNHTQSMVDNLLALARLEGAQMTFNPEALRLDEYIEAAWQPLAEKSKMRGINFENTTPKGLSCFADRDSLSMTLSILLVNAAEYTNDSGRIGIEGAYVADEAKLTISNSGCGLPEEDVQHVFERFWRGDAARAKTGVHCGLGLALAQRLVTSLGGTLSAGVSEETFTVRLALPRGSVS